MDYASKFIKALGNTSEWKAKRPGDYALHTCITLTLSPEGEGRAVDQELRAEAGYVGSQVASAQFATAMCGEKYWEYTAWSSATLASSYLGGSYGFRKANAIHHPRLRLLARMGIPLAAIFVGIYGSAFCLVNAGICLAAKNLVERYSIEADKAAHSIANNYRSFQVGNDPQDVSLIERQTIDILRRTDKNHAHCLDQPIDDAKPSSLGAWLWAWHIYPQWVQHPLFDKISFLELKQ